jgi:cadmium resistance protein CadD (predicted permease)
MTPPLAASAVAAAVAYFATSVDELVIFVVLFSRSASSGSPAEVALGIALGSVAVLGVSLLGAAGLLIPAADARWLKLFGLLPLVLGVRQLVRRALKARRRRAAMRAAAAAGAAAAPTALDDAAQAEEALLPAAVDSVDPPPSPAPVKRAAGVMFAKCLTPNVAEALAVTLAGGSEEVSVFLPLIAAEAGALANVAVIISTLTALTVAWVALAAALVRVPPVARTIEHVGEALEPWLVICVGLYCLVGSPMIPVHFW